MKTVLLTGFEPFGGDTVNPSWEVARSLADKRLDDARIVSVRLPCAFAEAPQALRQALQRHAPDFVVCLGQAEGRSEITPERVALNLVQARMPDNAGAQPQEEPVIAGGPVAYFSTLPVTRLVRRLNELNIPASLSNTAGTFVCNQVFYVLQHEWARPGRGGGFVHLPCLPEQAARHSPPAPSLPLAVQVQAIRELLQTIIA